MHTTVVGRPAWQVELPEDVAHVRLDGLRGHPEPLIPRSVSPSAISSEHLALSPGQLVERAPARGDGPSSWVTSSGSTTVSPVATRSKSRDELACVEDTILQQVAAVPLPRVHEAERIGRLHVLGEHEDADRRMVGANRLRGAETLVGVRGRHTDVDDRDVGLVLGDERE